MQRRATSPRRNDRPAFISPHAVPTASHPRVRDAELTDLVLALRFIHDIRFLERVETEIVSPACASLSAQELFSAPSRIRECAAEVSAHEAQQAIASAEIIDHATSVGPRRLRVAMGQPAMPSFVDAVHVVAQNHEKPSLVYLFAAVVAEILSAERLIASSRGPGIDPMINGFLVAHADEEREHATLFADVCRIAWGALDDRDRRAVLDFLPRLLDCYVIPSRATCVAILDDAGIEVDDAEAIFAETYTRSRLVQIIEPQVSIATRVFARAGMLDSEEGRLAFSAFVHSKLP